MRCSLCGAENPDDKTFCSSCGAYLGGPSDGPEARPAEAQPAPQPQQTAPATAAQAYPQPATAPACQQPAATAQQAFAQAPAYAQPRAVDPSAPYAKPGARRTLTLVAFAFCIVGIATALINIAAMALSNPNGALVYGVGAALVLVYKVPMTVHAWGICKGRKRIGTAFAVCTLLFGDLVAGILLLVAKKHD